MDDLIALMDSDPAGWTINRDMLYENEIFVHREHGIRVQRNTSMFRSVRIWTDYCQWTNPRDTKATYVDTSVLSRRALRKLNKALDRLMLCSLEAKLKAKLSGAGDTCDR